MRYGKHRLVKRRIKAFGVVEYWRDEETGRVWAVVTPSKVRDMPEHNG